jgi:hypothetical protein
MAHPNEAKNIVMITGAAIAGAFSMALMVKEPVAANPENCKLYKVSTETRVAYVLRPPPAPPPEKIIVKEACAPVVQPEEAENTATEKCEEKKNTSLRKRHRYGYRHRRWRWR